MENVTEIVVPPLNNSEDKLAETVKNEASLASDTLNLPKECVNEITVLPAHAAENIEVVELRKTKAQSESEISLQNTSVTEIIVSPIHNEEDATELSISCISHEIKDKSNVSLLEATEGESIVSFIQDEDRVTEFVGSAEIKDQTKEDVCIPNAIVNENKDETECLSIIQTSFTDEDQNMIGFTDIVPFNEKKINPVILCSLDDNSSSKLLSSANGPRWETVLPQGVYCKDFIPKKCPDRSSCWTTIYTSFGEVVEEANAWLSIQTKLRVVACEAVPMNASGSSAQRDAWPHHTVLRGVRVWVQKSADECPHVVLGYRDFIPRQKTKSIFSGTAQTLEELCGCISSYLTNRLPSVSLVSVQTLDAPLSGMYDTDIETESGTVSYAPNGFTRFCRFLRVFFLSECQTFKTKKIAPTAVVVGLKDFSARSNEDTITQVIERALEWCNAQTAVRLCNVEVLNQKAGHASSSYTWLLESPGMVHGKFYRFVRLVYMLDDLVDEQELLERKWEEMNAITPTPWRDRFFSEEFEGGIWNMELKGFRCTTFLPQMVEPHCSVWGGVWETTEELTNRVGAWLMERKRQVVTISTHHVRTVGNSVSLDDTAWVRHAPFAVWLPVIHVITTS
ncbi:hypothetical protein FHG87_014099 [Trinorchestia longiramus]|nr:hypothetical protein FHG87_014099 [Trinorchestia longiramus]